MIKHIVMWKFKEDKKEEMNLFLTNLLKLKDEIKEIKYMEVKTSINKNNMYDAVLISKFNNLEDLKKYKENEKHVKVSSLCKEIRLDRAAIDIEE